MTKNSKQRAISALLLSVAMLFSNAWASPVAPPSEAPQAQTAQPSTGTLIGMVVDDSGEPLIGASIKVEGVKIIAVTDANGEFILKDVKLNSKVTASYVGYNPETLEWTGGSLRFVLKENSQALEEVVVTAFGAGQKKESLTGAVQSVKPSDLKVPSANLSNSFAGRLAGVVSYQRSGEPGSNGSNFYIRGIATISGVTSPLIVLDGVEVSSADLNALDPDVIESFSILKDATATAMYGSRGANGVMIVKTKTGADLDKPIITVRAEAYVTTPTKIQKFVDGPTYMRMYNEAVTNQGTGDVLFTKEQIRNTANGVNKYLFPNVDWYNEIFREMAFNQKATFNIRGGTNKITYFMNLTVNHETGMLKDVAKQYYSYGNNINLTKYAFQNNIDFNMSKSSKISLHLNTQLNNYSGPANNVASIFTSIMNNNPVDFPITFPYNEDGDWAHWGILAGSNTQGVNNPMATATSGYQDYFESTVIANINFVQNLDVITPGLNFNAMLSFKNWSYTTRTRTQSSTNSYAISSWQQNPDGSYSYDISPIHEPNKPVLSTSSGTTGDRRFYFQTYFSYDRSFGDNNVSGMVLFDLNDYNVNAPQSLIASLPQRKMGFAFRATYNYAYRYLLEFNAGYTGSENFAKKHRWGFFPSGSIGWNIANEPFWESIQNTVSTLKLRASYGLVGNDQFSDARFLYLAQVNLTGSAAYQTGYGNYQTEMSGPTYDRFQNDNITWEVGHKLNVGVDVSLWNSLNVTLEGFHETRKNIFQQKNSIPNYFGTSGTTIYGNLAEVKNWGFEASVDWLQKFGDWTVAFKGTFTFARNKISKYDEGAGTRPALQNVGKKLNTIYGYVSDGLYVDYADIANSATSTLGNIAIAPGDIKYIDQPDAFGNYDGVITSDDRVALGYPTVPEIIYGFGPSITWKNWDFSFFFQGVANTSLMIYGFEPFGTQYNRNVLSWIADDYWSQSNQNPNASYPRLTKYNNNHNTQYSDFWLRNGSFLKLKNIELGYTFKTARFYISAANVCTFAPFKLWDPEMGSGSALAYPTQRTFNVGVQVKFN